MFQLVFGVKKKQLSKEEVLYTRQVSSLRCHVERVNGLVLEIFKCLSGVLEKWSVHKNNWPFYCTFDYIITVEYLLILYIRYQLLKLFAIY